MPKSYLRPIKLESEEVRCRHLYFLKLLSNTNVQPILRDTVSKLYNLVICYFFIIAIFKHTQKLTVHLMVPNTQLQQLSIFLPRLVQLSLPLYFYLFFAGMFWSKCQTNNHFFFQYFSMQTLLLMINWLNSFLLDNERLWWA